MVGLYYAEFLYLSFGPKKIRTQFLHPITNPAPIPPIFPISKRIKDKYRSPSPAERFSEISAPSRIRAQLWFCLREI
jgi:hypothetical protein